MTNLRLPFMFDRYFVTATFADVERPSRERQGRGETAWQLLENGTDVALEVRVPDNDDCVLHFENGRYQGYRCEGQEFPDRDTPERRRFLLACERRLLESEGEKALSGAARWVVSDLLKAS